MTKALVMVLGLVAGGVYGWVDTPPARCHFCPTYPCFGHCGGKCSCMRRGSEPGQCVSLDFKDSYLAHGYTLDQSR